MKKPAQCTGSTSGSKFTTGEASIAQSIKPCTYLEVLKCNIPKDYAIMS